MMRHAEANGWEKVKLKEVCRHITVGFVGSMAKYYVDDGIPFLRSQNIQPFNLDLTALKFIAPQFDKKIKKSALYPGDVAVVRTGYPGTACVIPNNLPISNCADLVIIRPGEQIDAHFLSAIFNSTWGRGVVEGTLVGVAQQHFNVGAAKEMIIYLPPLETQRKISAVLSAYDDLIENNTRRIAILEEMAQALYREWFVHFRFPGHEDVKMVEVEGYGMVPEGWEILTLGDMRVTSLITRGYQPKYDESSDCRVVNQRCIRNHRIDYNLTRGNDEEKRPVVRKERFLRFGDILINSTGVGTLGRVAQVYEDLSKHIVDSHVTIVRPTEESDIDYLGVMMWEMEPDIEQLGVGATGQTELNRQRISDINLIVAQEELRVKFAEIARPMRRQAQNLIRKNENLGQTRDLLLPRLISGELDVSELNLSGVEDST